MKRGVATFNNCPLCDEIDEMLNHLMLQRSYSRTYWRIIFSPFSLPDLPYFFTNMRVSWRHPSQVHSLYPTLECLLITSVWSLWKECNARVFHFITNMPPVAAQKAISIYRDWLANVPHPNVTRVLSLLSQAGSWSLWIIIWWFSKVQHLYWFSFCG